MAASGRASRGRRVLALAPESRAPGHEFSSRVTGWARGEAARSYDSGARDFIYSWPSSRALGSRNQQRRRRRRRVPERALKPLEEVSDEDGEARSGPGGDRAGTMPMIEKIWGPGQPHQPSSRGNLQHFGRDCVRILLFRECEWQGRKLLFDSITMERNKQRKKEDNDNIPLFRHNVIRNRQIKCQRDNAFIISADDFPCERGKLLDEDINLLSEMIFGTVAMTYKGPSFKIHAMQSPGYIMCTKVFPYKVCKQREGGKDCQDTSSVSTNTDSDSSDSKQRNQYFRSSTGNLVGNLSTTVDKNSTCLNIRNGWSIDAPNYRSTQSLDGNGRASINSSSGINLSSLRRRWLRVMSTSLNRFGSDDPLGCSNQNPTTETKDVHARKHKSRLGLAMILQLPNGQEQKITGSLLEHAALLEGMLDRLRHSCFEGKILEGNLVNRLRRMSNCCTLRLLRLLSSLETQVTTSLTWHDLLLNSTLPSNIKINTVYRNFHQMFLLLEQLDTKSTNFFLSTIVTAVLTHHLGWVHTAPPRRNRQLVGNPRVEKRFACNPLWAQLNDLYGALGTPARVAHTVIAGEPDKTTLIDSILNFLSYFLRSGLVDRQHESRCPFQEDVKEAIDILERRERKKAPLEQPSSPSSSSKPTRTPEPEQEQEQEQEPEFPISKSESCEKLWKLKPVKEEEEDGAEKTVEKAWESVNKPTRSAISQKNLGEHEVDVQKRADVGEAEIISEGDEGEGEPGKEEEEEDEEGTPRGILIKKKPSGNGDADETLADLKPPVLRQQKLTPFDNFHSSSKTPEDQTLAYLSSLGEDATHEVTTQVYFSLDDEKKPSLSIRDRLRSSCKCQCAYTFTRVPSTSAELPEGVLRKIIQRNFPESSKNIQPSQSCESEFGVCLKCHRGCASSSQGFENSKLLLETPTNATEMLRGCRGPGTSRALSSNSLEALIEASCVIELPMPRSKKVSPQMRRKPSDRVGFPKSLLSAKAVPMDEVPKDLESGYTWGMVVQGFTKKKRKAHLRPDEKPKREWWWPIREGLGVEAKFPLVDQPVSEALCILGDLDSWQVGLLSNSAGGSSPIPVGMSRLVSNMLEAFVCMWKEFRSPAQCIKLLESRLREMWMRSETLAEYLLETDLTQANMSNLTTFLDLDAADLPLLLAVATTHTPQVAQKLGLTLA